MIMKINFKKLFTKEFLAILLNIAGILFVSWEIGVISQVTFLCSGFLWLIVVVWGLSILDKIGKFLEWDFDNGK